MKYSKTQMAAIKDLDPQATLPYIPISSQSQKFRHLSMSDVENAKTVPVRLKTSDNDTLYNSWANKEVTLCLSPKNPQFLCIVNDDGSLFHEFSWMESDAIAAELNTYARIVESSVVEMIVFDEENGCFRTKRVEQ